LGNCVDIVRHTEDLPNVEEQLVRELLLIAVRTTGCGNTDRGKRVLCSQNRF